MKIKTKTQKKIILWILFAIFWLSAEVFSQYYYFDNGWKTYQQWCNETVDIRINSDWENVRVWSFHLILDPLTTIYPHTDDVETLRRDLVNPSANTFADWAAGSSPSWKSGSNYTILQIDRVNVSTDYNGTNWLFWTIKFVPIFSVSDYDIQFWMDYLPLTTWSESTIETTLGKVWWTELINPAQQLLHRTETYQILKEPCIPDTNKPSISNLSITDGSSKKSNGDGLSFSLNDNWGVNWTTNVPYVFNAGAEWTWNAWWAISNQYWINQDSFQLTLSGNGQTKVITKTTPWVTIAWNWKTWQNLWLNANVTLTSQALFDFWIEKKITATFTFSDRAGNSQSYTINFNSPKGPTLISNSTSPAGGDVYVNLMEPIKLWIKDDWAGVDSGTIKITLSGVNWTDYWPYVFSGSDLNLSGVQWNANQPDYYVNITNHVTFPTSGTIKVSVYAKDMEWTVDSISDYTFSTRPNCSEFQCCDPVLLDLWSGNTTYYTNTWLIISGWVNPTFSGDEQNITWVIDCNTENEWLSVYTWEDNFMFFTDESELTILWTWVKWVLSWNVLTLSYIIDSAEIIVDKPSSGQILTTGDVDIRWHLTWVDDEDDWLSGYYIEIYSWDTLITWWFVDGTWITESLLDGEYEFVVYPMDLWWHTGSAATWTFSIDTVVPSVVLTGNDVWMCSPAWTIYTITWSFSETVTGINASTLSVVWWTVQNFTMVSGDIAVWTVSAGWNGGGSSYMHYQDGTISICDPSSNGTKCITMQDKNLWATKAGTECSATDTWVCGYHFQWWNNHWFEIWCFTNSCSDAVTKSATSTLAIWSPDYNHVWYNWTTFVKWTSSNKYDYWSDKTPSNHNWLRWWENDTAENNYWFDEINNVATNVGNRRWPCEEWYHVPSIWERWTLLKYRVANYTWAWNTNLFLWYTNGLPHINVNPTIGRQFQEDFKIPFAGRHGRVDDRYPDARVYKVGTDGHLWSSSPRVDSDLVRFFSLDKNGAFADTNFQRSYGLSLRCFKDSYLSFPSSEGGDSSTGALVISIETWAFEDLAGNTNTTWTDELSWDYDWEGPEFTLDDVEVEECTEWTMTISWVTQVWCASGHVSPYSWDAWATWWLTSTNTAYSGWIGEKIMTVRVRDAFWNYTEKTWKYTWTNVNPSVEDISVENVWLWTWINWRELSNAHEWTCWTWTIEFSWFIDDWSHWTCTEEWWIITYVADTDTEYEWEDSCVFEITDDEWYTATWVITFTWIDTKKPTCEISYNENVCTSGDIALTMNATWAAEYSWNWFTNMSSNNLSHNVHWNGVYTWYVRDNVGNTWICTVEVETFDNIAPIVTIPAVNLVAEECTLIQWNISVADNWWCGDWFSYLWWWFGLGNDLSYSWYSEVVTWKTATVFVWDPAWNMASGTLNYTWTDTWVQLNSDEKIISDIVLTWGNSYNTTTWDLISLFGAREWNCGEKYISVSKISCNWLSMDIDAEWNVVVTWNNNLTQTGSCELRFSDDDGNSETWTLKIRVDTVVPWVEIQWTNLACMSGSSFSVTWIFTESVQWFVVWNISVENGTPSNLLWNGSGYTWTVNMNPNVEVKVKVPASAAFDLNWNPNTESNELTGMYDTAWPNKVILSERTKVYSETSKFTWQSVSDSGCAWVSGYIRELYEWSCEWTPKDSWITGAENFTVSWLENSGSYCRRVRSVDNFWNMWEWSDGDDFVVDLSDIWCDFDYVQTCTNWTLQVTLVPGDEWYTDNWTVYLSWRETGHWQNVSGLTTWVTYSGQTLIWYIWQPATEKFNSCTFVATNIIDKANPEITSVTVESVPECTTWTAIATAISDEWCGQWTYTYNWNSEWYMESNSFQRYLTESWTQIISLKVRDNALNESTSTWVVFVWTDSPISGNNFTWHTSVWKTARTVNWREMSEVSDWDCGSGTITFSGFINSWTKWTCTRSWDEITYTPNPNEVWDDSCTIQVKDDEWWTKDIVISWEWIDTKAPVCTVNYEPNACVSGSVAIILRAYEEINSAIWWDINRWISGMSATWDIFANWSGNVVISDLVWNTWVCEVVVNNIRTWVLSAPSDLTIVWWTPTNDNTPEFIWEAPESDWCREVSGYIVQILSWWTEIDLIEVDWTWWISPDLPDGEYTIVVKTEDSLSWESEWTEITFVIDRTPPNCSIDVMTENCTNSGVEVKLSWDTSDILTYSRWNWTTWNFWNNITTIVNGNGEYTWYVYDEAWNEWVCVWVVWTWIQDQILISYTTNDAVWFECEVIIWSIVWNTWDSCWKNDLSKFTYSRPWWINTSEYWTISGNVWIVDIDVIISDWAWNSTWTTVRYTWNDTWVTLSSWVSQNIAVLTWTFEKTVAEIVDLFWATEWACWTWNITVTWTICSWASISVENWIVSINPDADLDWVDWYCEFEFWDNEWEKTTTWKVMFIVDTKQPWVILTWTNLVCMNSDTFDVTWTFTEAMTWFESWDVNMSGGTVSNFNWNGSEYIWTVTMTPMVETTVFVPAWVATDLNWNENTESNKLTGMYDNVWPNDVSFVNWQDEIYLKNPIIFRSAVSDQGCAWLSGYNWVLSNWNSCNDVVDAWFTTDLFVNLDNLSHEATYTFCVQTVDNFWNTGNRITWGFYVDLNAVWCMFEETECSNEWITLTLIPSNPDWTWIYLSWTWAWYREDEPFLTQYVSEQWKMIIWYVYQTWDNPKQSSCIYTVQKIDKSEPTITSFADVSVPECSTWELNITAADEGCGNTWLYYSWDNSGFALNSTIYSLWSWKAWSRIVDVQVKDNVWNTVSWSATIERTDSEISGKNITVENVWRWSWVNWRELSEVSDWACGSGTVEFSGFVNTWSYGTCTTWEWDTIVYEPNEWYTWSDSCTIEVRDDDEQTIEIEIIWEWVDTEKPSCTLTVQEWQNSCISWTVNLILNSNSSDLSWYSFDRETFWNISTTGVSLIWIYTWYVIDVAWNISDPCTVEITWWVLDLDEPTLEVSDWIWYECDTWTITITWNDNSCGISWLYYWWEWFENTTNTNEIYSWIIWSQTVNVSVFDWVWHVTWKQVTYTWQNAPVTWSGFTVGNVWTWITVDWFVNWNVSWWICELDDIEAISSNTWMCEISGHNVIYKPTEWIQWGESCTITITDGDEEWSGDIEIEIIFTWVDTKKPTVTLVWWVWEQCTSENTFIVTWEFSEEVVWVITGTLQWENVNIVEFTGNWDTYSWTVEMLWWTWRVWLMTWWITDAIWNELTTWYEKILWNYDISLPSSVDLIKPANSWLSYSNTINFEWSGSIDEWCAWISWYILEICSDELCNDVIRSSSTSWTGKTEWSLWGSTWTWTGYWRVISEDMYWNTWVSIIQSFGVDARNPNCSIVEQEACTQWDVQLILTWDREISIIDNWWVNWDWTWMYYTWQVSENWNILVIVEDVEGRTWQCEIPVTKHDAEWPDIVLQTWEVNECEWTTIQIVANDTGCAGIDWYIFWSDFWLWNFQTSSGLLITAEQIWNVWWITIWQMVTVFDTLWKSTIATWYELDIVDVPVSLSGSNYSIWIITWTVEGLNIINIFWANEWSCWVDDLSVELWECSNATWTLVGNVLLVVPHDDTEWNGECEAYIKDNEWNIATWYILYQVDTQAPNCEIIYDITGITNQDVTATLNCSGTSWENWFATTWEVILTWDWEVIFEFKDENGNTWSITGIVDWIDKTAPECSIEYSPNTPTSWNVTWMLVQCNEPITVTNTSGNVSVYVFENTWTFIFEFVDEAWNTWEAIATVDRIDKDAPTCTVNVPDGWTNTWVTLTMDVVWDTTWYSWNDVDWLWTNTGLFVENTWLYTWYVRDEVWNVGICTWLVEKIDKQRPTITLEWTNISWCTSWNTFVVTWIFDEYVVEFTENNISITNWIISDFVEVISWIQYTWTVTMTGWELTLYVSENEVTDRAWNGNIESIVLTSNYDNTWPESVDLNERNTVYSESVTLSWNSVNDSGCAWVSGYIRELYEWVCGQWTPKDSWTTSSGTENFTVSWLENSGSYCRRVSPVDNFWNVWTWSEDNFDVDLTNIWCKITPVEGTVCTSGEIMVKLEADWDYTENWDVYFSWISTWDNTNTNTLTTWLTFSGQVVTWYISQPLTNKSNYCVYTSTNIIDQTAPTVESIWHTTWYECETITWSIEMTDEWCWSWLISYIWDWLEWTNNIEYWIISYSWNVGRTVYVTWYDEVWNSVSTWVYFRWLNSPISWNNFTWNSYVWNISRSVNWREMSAVSDWACGSGTIEIGMSSNLGSKWECVIQWDIVTYTPYEWQTWSDICIIDVQDDEWDTGAIEIYRGWIDTEKPSCNLALQDMQSCTSGEVILSLSSVSTDVVEYSFDWISWTTTITTWVNEIWTYTWYVKDNAWNISDPCIIEVTWEVLDLDEPEIETEDWIWYECSTWIIIVTWTDNSCGLSWLNYLWSWLGNTTNTNEIYSENVWSQIVEVTVFDWVWHSTGRQVTYTWQNIPVMWNSFIVENVWTWITVDWFTGANVSWWICELDDITATIEGSGSCEISGHDIIYTPTEWVAWEETCTVIITDWDEWEWGWTWIEIEITFTWVDTEKPTVQLQWWVWEQCTSGNTFTVTWVFSEDVEWVTIDRLTWENINIVDFTGNGDEYEWTVEMLWWTWRVWILTWWIRDMIWNEMMTWDEITLWNYDNSNPQWVSLLSPESGTGFNRRTIDFEWTASSDVWCAWLSWYRLQICSDNLCNDVAETFVVDTTWINVTLQENGNYFWTVVAFDQYWNQSTWQTRLFNVESNEPKCSIVQSECSSSPVSLTLTWNKEISIVSGNISWQQVSQAIYSSEITENIDVWAIVEDLDWQTGYCHLDVNNYDNVWPDFDFGDIEVNEWEPLTINIVANDTWCAWISWYIFWPEFGSWERQSSGVLEISA